MSASLDSRMVHVFGIVQSSPPKGQSGSLWMPLLKLVYDAQMYTKITSTLRLAVSFGASEVIVQGILALTREYTSTGPHDDHRESALGV
ncbi:hypothetical protein RRG08_043083 [Elysia crispata]|uniref:Uncharacterized protein n=1 Tax=Elysia crispata TaxID=231223 RepID=A0AAE0XYK9_9GAST|nr:hypothetical protein RRG08_043083 [Elysia crispata]